MPALVAHNSLWVAAASTGRALRRRYLVQQRRITLQKASMPDQRSSKPSAAGIGVALDPRPGAKVYKVRLYHKGSVLNLGR
jgi:hypothetical protein